LSKIELGIRDMCAIDSRRARLSHYQSSLTVIALVFTMV